MNIIEKLGITEGPWKGLHGDGVDRRGNKHVYAAIPYGQICIVDKTVDDVKNTQLIAAAPEMLEALIEMCEDRCHTCRIFNPQHKNCTSCNDIEVWRKTIEKATGRTWEEIKELL